MLLLLLIWSPVDNSFWQKKTQEFEGGFVPETYIDSTGNPTVGYGFNRNAYPYLPATMTKEQADQYFIPIYQDARKRAQKFSGSAWDYLSPNQQGIVIDMAYNLGDKLYDFKNMQKNLQNYNIEGTKKEMVNSKWYKQTGNRSKYNVENWDWTPFMD